GPEESPTSTPNVPSGSTQPLALSFQYDRSWPVRVKWTVVDCPGFSVTFWNPLSWGGGAPPPPPGGPARPGRPRRGAAPLTAGSSRYSWATSEPVTLPVLVTTADTVTCLLDGPLQPQAGVPGLDVLFMTCRGETLRWL